MLNGWSYPELPAVKFFAIFREPVSRLLRKTQRTESSMPNCSVTEPLARFFEPMGVPPTVHWMSARVKPDTPAGDPVSVIVTVFGHEPASNSNWSNPSKPFVSAVKPLLGIAVPPPAVMAALNGQPLDLSSTAPGIVEPICFSTVTVPAHCASAISLRRLPSPAKLVVK